MNEFKKDLLRLEELEEITEVPDLEEFQKTLRELTPPLHVLKVGGWIALRGGSREGGYLLPPQETRKLNKETHWRVQVPNRWL